MPDPQLLTISRFVDPGISDYFRFPAWAEYSRRTRIHNTVIRQDPASPLTGVPALRLPCLR